MDFLSTNGVTGAGMKPIADLFGKTYSQPVKKEHRTERHELIAFFIEKVNPPRVRDGYKPLTPAALNYFMSHVPTKDLYLVRSKCEEGVRAGFPFDAIFWQQIKEKTKPSPRRKKTNFIRPD